MKTVAILQSNYIPWIGFFQLLGHVDEFIFFDDMQFTKRDWRNRNRIKTSNGVAWLSIPVKTSGKYLQSINEVVIADQSWSKKHWKSIELNYKKSCFFEKESDWLKQIYAQNLEHLTDINQSFIRAICEKLDIKTKLAHQSTANYSTDKNLRLIEICKDRAATRYVSGQAAKDYIIPDTFEENGISLEWFEYPEYPAYSQPWGPHEKNLSIIDAILNIGSEETAKIIKDRDKNHG